MDGGEAFGSAGALLLFALYMLPAILGIIRKVENTGSIVVVNLFLGWTLIGWVVALAMAVKTRRP